ncbi:MAG: protein kinase [Anaerolineae bacterium]|nr:protein kinase [Anaerolineae bacterium]
MGQGGMATVFKAYHEQLNRHVAIKVMHQNFLDDATFVARFTREAQIVAKLEHPNIVPVYDFDEHDGLPFLVMKYIQGRTLKHKLIKKPLTLDEVLYVIGAIGSALTYSHKNGVLHRDIKPSNIVLDMDDVPYLTDFGLARVASSGESTMSADMLLGTPHYISPEQARGDKDLDGRTDIYSLGVVLYELLVGHVPYTGDTPYSIIHDHIYTPLPEPTKVNPEIPLAVEEVLYKALEKDRDDRYATANDLVEDLRSAIDEAHLTELDPSRVTRAMASLATARAEAVHDVRTPTGIASPIQQPTTSIPTTFRTAMLKKKSLRWYQGERIWPVSGCAVFLAISFLACGILLNMSTNLLELQSLANKGAIEVDTGPDGISVELLPLGIGVNNSLGYSIYEVPVRPLSLVRGFEADEPEHSVVYLSLAVSLWANGDNEAARQAIQDGYVVAEDKTHYLVNATFAADQNGDEAAAMVYVITTLESARADAELFSVLRPIGGQYIYNNANGIDLSDEEQQAELARLVMTDFSLTESPFALLRLLAVKLLMIMSVRLVSFSVALKIAAYSKKNSICSMLNLKSCETILPMRVQH